MTTQCPLSTPEARLARKQCTRDAGRLGKQAIEALGATHGGAVSEKLAQMPPVYRIRYLKAMTQSRPKLAIAAFCAECMGWEGLPEAIKSCTSPACPLYPYRPYRRAIE